MAAFERLFLERGLPSAIRSDNALRREGERRTGQQVSVRECALAA
jgi:hypothetical protein